MARYAYDPLDDLDSGDEFQLTPEEQAALLTALGQVSKNSAGAMSGASPTSEQPIAAGDDEVYADMQRRYKQLQGRLNDLDQQIAAAPDPGSRAMLNIERDSAQNQLTSLGRSLDVMRQRRQPKDATQRQPSLVNLDSAKPYLYERQPDGTIIQKDNPAYDPQAAAAKAARAMPQDRAARDEAAKVNAAANMLRAQVAAGKMSADQAQRELDNFIKQQEAETKARESEIKAILDQYGDRTTLAGNIATNTVAAWREAMPFMVPRGFNEQFAATLDAFRTGKLPEFAAFTAPFPYDPNTLAQNAAMAAFNTIPTAGITYRAPSTQPEQQELPEGATFRAPMPPQVDWSKQFQVPGR